MKKLLIIRHAEAENPAATADFDRPLSAKGEKDVMALAQKLAANNLFPELVVSSTSLRTTTTAQLLTKQLPIVNTQSNPRIYEASEQTLLHILNQFNDAYQFVAMVGHNPGISYLLFNLTGEVRDVPPCTAVLISFDVDEWQALSLNSGTITYYTSPHALN